MLIEIVSVFPGLFRGVFSESILKRAQEKGLVEIRVHDLRAFSDDKHRKVDDAPYGGGPGMVMKPEPFFKAVRTIREKCPLAGRVILFSPQGKLLTQERLRELSEARHLILLCGRYEGVDERVRTYLADEEISIGDYGLPVGRYRRWSVDALIRLLPGVLNEAPTGGIFCPGAAGISPVYPSPGF